MGGFDPYEQESIERDLEIWEAKDIDSKFEFALEHFELEVQEIIQEKLYEMGLNTYGGYIDYFYKHKSEAWNWIEESYKYDDILIKWLEEV